VTWTRLGLLIAAAFLLAGAAARPPRGHLATGRISVTGWPYFPGSVIPLRIAGFAPPYHAALLGPGFLSPDGIYEVDNVASRTTTLLVAGNAAGLAATTLHVAPPPAANRALAVVASYDDGLVFHDVRNFSVLGLLGMNGAPAAVAIDPSGTIAAPDTDGSSVTRVSLIPWNVATIGGVLTGDDVAIDSATGAIFVTDRDADGSGALTRIAKDGSIARVATGETAEGLAIDQHRGIVYVANTNDGTIAAVDANSMRVLRRFHAVDRVFSLALNSDGSMLYAVSNQSVGSFLGAPGSVVVFALRGQPRALTRSAPLNFPLGIALDEAAQRVFVTEEGVAEVDVLDARTLRRTRAPLHTCKTPWKPTLDAQTQRLYIPCAGADAVDVFDSKTLRRVPGAPFRTGSYPLAVALWHPSERTLPRKQ
jgi:DNA-binding beta-propeller fold protein YncE